ncbi:GNAT family N-acetyltransferase [Fodinibius sediminis]|uniref:Acetyltransferase (GNAT) family protein n=1 Tax=Fodinibius sediminis TaxID=1214077 RepID=A0A521DE58_9BACT|nr:GNAT family N-acetyltransferase [Fodinibius sediminis]SMO69250.1 Acetyltransferase (GNAT) family protein [Fodinibius sediminis]
MPQKIPTDIPGCYLRFAEKEDTALILDFIHGLAAYEKMADQVVATEELLRKNLFGKQSYAEVLLAYDRDEPVGFALFFHSFSTFRGQAGIYLEDLYVNPSARGRGIGTALLAFLAQLAVERDCARLEWSVLNWNKPAIDFYESLKARPLDDWTTYRLSGRALRNMAQHAASGQA